MTTGGHKVDVGREGSTFKKPGHKVGREGSTFKKTWTQGGHREGGVHIQKTWTQGGRREGGVHILLEFIIEHSTIGRILDAHEVERIQLD